MKIFKSPFSHPSDNAISVAATNMSIHSWYSQLHTEPARFIDRIEMCTAGSTGEDAWGTPVDGTHLHTLIRVFLAPVSDGSAVSGHTLLIERVLSTGGAHHSVTPIPEALSGGGTLFHPEVRDRVCVISEGPPTAVERMLAFDGGGCSSAPRLSLAQLAQIVAFVGRMTEGICAGGDCAFQSRAFAFTCLAALTRSLPSCTLARRPGERVDMNVRDGTAGMDDSVFEVSTVTFLGQVSRSVRDEESMKALGSIESLRAQPREVAAPRLHE